MENIYTEYYKQSKQNETEYKQIELYADCSSMHVMQPWNEEKFSKSLMFVLQAVVRKNGRREETRRDETRRDEVVQMNAERMGSKDMRMHFFLH